MQTLPAFQKYPDTWLKIWLAIGVLAFVLFVLIPAAIGSLVQNEAQRAHDCAMGTRQDCQPSLIWAFYGWSGAPGSSNEEAATSTANEQATSTQPEFQQTQTSSTAPTIFQATLLGASFEGGWYRAAVGTKLTVQATVANAKTVALYLRPTDNPTSVKKIATMTKQKGGNYTATMTVSPGLSAQLEIRATAANGESSSLFLDVAAN